jgi:hypothetical protein
MLVVSPMVNATLCVYQNDLRISFRAFSNVSLISALPAPRFVSKSQELRNASTYSRERFSSRDSPPSSIGNLHRQPGSSPHRYHVPRLPPRSILVGDTQSAGRDTALPRARGTAAKSRHQTRMLQPVSVWILTWPCRRSLIVSHTRRHGIRPSLQACATHPTGA